MQMNGHALLAVCKQHRLYQTPCLNDKLYANFKGFTSLGGLEPYTGLRALFLEGNALSSIEGLPPLPELRCLFLQQNVLLTVTPELAALPQLDTLNLSGNTLEDLTGLAGCASLRTLLAADNQLAETAAIQPLAACPALESVDLQNNKLEDGNAVLAVLQRLPSLKCLYLRGNPLVSSLRSYRKTVIAALPGLTYLDDRPVFELERLCAEAWTQGGVEAERDARAAYHERQQQADKRRVEALREIREAGWRKRREALGLPLEGGDPDLLDVPQHEAELHAVDEDEPPELVAARQRLEAFTAAKAGQAGQQEAEAPKDLGEADAQVLVEERQAHRAVLAAETSKEGCHGSVDRCYTLSPEADTHQQTASQEACPAAPRRTTNDTAGDACPAVTSEGCPPTAELCDSNVPEASITVTLASRSQGQATQPVVANAGKSASVSGTSSPAAGSPQVQPGLGGEAEGSASVLAYSAGEDDCLCMLD